MFWVQAHCSCHLSPELWTDRAAISSHTAPSTHGLVHQQRAWPQVLVVKALLKQWRLNEVFHGGLSSYSAVLLALAHLLHERGGGPSPDFDPTRSPVFGQGFGADIGSGPGSSLAVGGGEPDLGHVLLGFLERYGVRFDYEREAVSVRAGGVVPKPRAWRQASAPHPLVFLC